MDQVTLGIQQSALRKSRVRRSWCLTLGLALAIQGLAHAADQPLEYQVKAAFLLNFTKFTEWPAEAFDGADSPIAICVLGDDPFGNTLDKIVAGEVVNGRKVIVRRTKHIPPPKSCQALFVGNSGKDVTDNLAGLGPGILTIGEGEAFVRLGGIIAFVLEDRRVRFCINEAAAQTAGLKLSSKLLNVAKSVGK